jgi:hypothetical protein
MWDVFPNDMGLDSSIELALANLDLNEPVIELVTFEDGYLLDGSSSTSANARIALDIEEEEDGGRAVVVMSILMIMTWTTTDSYDS